VHAGTAIGPVRQSEGRPDMRQINHVLLLAQAGRQVVPARRRSRSG
jgi:hypothetical protein